MRTEEHKQHERERQRMRHARLKHDPKYRARKNRWQREYAARQRQKPGHVEERRERDAVYLATNREHINARRRAWYHANKERLSQYAKDWRAKKKARDDGITEEVYEYYGMMAHPSYE